jgi:hypothetical protein
MAAPVTPAKKLANGKDTWWLVPAGTNINAPTVAEVNHATGLNISGMLLQDYEGLSVSTDRVTLPQVMLETVTTEISGQTTITAADMQITFQPQAAAAADGKKAWELLDGGGWEGWAVRRQDSPAGNGDVTAGEFVDVAVVEIGQPIPGKTTSGADGIYIFTAPVSPIQVSWNKAVAA